MEHKKYKPKIAPIRNIKSHKTDEKINFNAFTKNKNMTLLFNNKTKTKMPFEIRRDKFENQTFMKNTLRCPLPKIKLTNNRKKNFFETKFPKNKSEFFLTSKIVRSSSQENINVLTKQKNFMNSFSSKIEQKLKKPEVIINNDYDTEIENMNVNEYIKKIKDDFKDNGKIIKIKFMVDKDRIYEYAKNEFVILKIFENELKQNQGLDVKGFLYNDKKINMYNSLRDEKIGNNSVIKVII